MAGIAYKVFRGDRLISQEIFLPETIQRGLALLDAKGAGSLAYTPDVAHEFERILERRLQDDDGPYRFEMPHYAPIAEDGVAAFYGVDTDLAVQGLPNRAETIDERIERLLDEAAQETLVIIPGVAAVMENFAREDWARTNPRSDDPISIDLKSARMRAPGENEEAWDTLATPLNVSDKTNTIELYGDEGLLPGYDPTWGMSVFPQVHPAWSVDANVHPMHRVYDT